VKTEKKTGLGMRAYKGLLVKDNYGRWPERDLAGPCDLSAAIARCPGH
jgi:hypothetical protein